MGCRGSHHDRYVRRRCRDVCCISARSLRIDPRPARPAENANAQCTQCRIKRPRRFIPQEPLRHAARVPPRHRPCADHGSSVAPDKHRRPIDPLMGDNRKVRPATNKIPEH
jgi:hypothetical protein